MHILVVEDETRLREQLRDRLRGSGYVVDVAADGEEGLYYGEEYPLDLAIIDIGLPKLSGIELIRRLRSRDRHFPILILTARGNWQDKVDGLESGADDYLVKPFEAEVLVDMIRRYLPEAGDDPEVVAEDQATRKLAHLARRVAASTAAIAAARTPRSSNTCRPAIVVPPGLVTRSFKTAGCSPSASR